MSVSALKEWSAVCRRLAEGTQVLLLRKGGILEVREGFQVEHKEFLLYPTWFHQRESELIPSAQAEPRDAAPGRVRMELVAEVAAATFVDRLETALALEGRHCLTREAVEKRFNYGRRPGLWALVLRVYRLLAPVEIEETEAVRGCVSWIQIPGEPEVAIERPVLTRAEFDRQSGAIRKILEGPK